MVQKGDIGGGGLMDIGCYPISLSRYSFYTEPKRVHGDLEFDPNFQVDRMTSGVLDFGVGTATFTVERQLSPYQGVNILGTLGRIEIEIPLNAPPDKPTRLQLQRDKEIEEIQFHICDRYTIQCDEFLPAILSDVPVPMPLEDAVANMKVIDAFFCKRHVGKVGGRFLTSHFFYLLRMALDYLSLKDAKG